MRVDISKYIKIINEEENKESILKALEDAESDEDKKEAIKKALKYCKENNINLKKKFKPSENPNDGDLVSVKTKKKSLGSFKEYLKEAEKLDPNSSNSLTQILKAKTQAGTQAGTKAKPKTNGNINIDEFIDSLNNKIKDEPGAELEQNELDLLKNMTPGQVNKLSDDVIDYIINNELSDDLNNNEIKKRIDEIKKNDQDEGGNDQEEMPINQIDDTYVDNLDSDEINDLKWTLTDILKKDNPFAGRHIKQIIEDLNNNKDILINLNNDLKKLLGYFESGISFTTNIGSFSLGLQQLKLNDKLIDSLSKLLCLYLSFKENGGDGNSGITTKGVINQNSAIGKYFYKKNDSNKEYEIIKDKKELFEIIKEGFEKLANLNQSILDYFLIANDAEGIKKLINFCIENAEKGIFKGDGDKLKEFRSNSEKILKGEVPEEILNNLKDKTVQQKQEVKKDETTEQSNSNTQQEVKKDETTPSETVSKEPELSIHDRLYRYNTPVPKASELEKDDSGNKFDQLDIVQKYQEGLKKEAEKHIYRIVGSARLKLTGKTDLDRGKISDTWGECIKNASKLNKTLNEEKILEARDRDTDTDGKSVGDKRLNDVRDKAIKDMGKIIEKKVGEIDATYEQTRGRITYSEKMKLLRQISRQLADIKNDLYDYEEKIEKEAKEKHGGVFGWLKDRKQDKQDRKEAEEKRRNADPNIMAYDKANKDKILKDDLKELQNFFNQVKEKNNSDINTAAAYLLCWSIKNTSSGPKSIINNLNKSISDFGLGSKKEIKINNEIFKTPKEIYTAAGILQNLNVESLKSIKKGDIEGLDIEDFSDKWENFKTEEEKEEQNKIEKGAEEIKKIFGPPDPNFSIQRLQSLARWAFAHSLMTTNTNSKALSKLNANFEKPKKIYLLKEITKTEKDNITYYTLKPDGVCTTPLALLKAAYGDSIVESINEKTIKIIKDTQNDNLNNFESSWKSFINKYNEFESSIKKATVSEELVLNITEKVIGEAWFNKTKKNPTSVEDFLKINGIDLSNIFGSDQEKNTERVELIGGIGPEDIAFLQLLASMYMKSQTISIVKHNNKYYLYDNNSNNSSALKKLVDSLSQEERESKTTAAAKLGPIVKTDAEKKKEEEELQKSKEHNTNIDIEKNANQGTEQVEATSNDKETTSVATPPPNTSTNVGDVVQPQQMTPQQRIKKIVYGFDKGKYSVKSKEFY